MYGHNIKKHIEAVERGQRRVIKQLPGMKDLPGETKHLNIVKPCLETSTRGHDRDLYAIT